MSVPRQASTASLILMLAALACSCAPQGPTPPETHLEITIKSDGSAVSAQYILDCSGDSALETSTLPGAAEACTQLSQNPGVLATSLDPATPCTEIYGGPQRAQVSGTFNGKPITSEFSRSNGCLISQWDAAQFLFGNGS